MSKLKITPSEVEQSGSDLQQRGSRLHGITGRMGSTSQNLGTLGRSDKSGLGKVFSKLGDKLDAAASKAGNEIARVLTGMGTRLTTTGRTTSKTDQDNKHRFEGIGGKSDDGTSHPKSETPTGPSPTGRGNTEPSSAAPSGGTAPQSETPTGPSPTGRGNTEPSSAAPSGGTAPQSETPTGPGPSHGNNQPKPGKRKGKGKGKGKGGGGESSSSAEPPPWPPPPHITGRTGHGEQQIQGRDGHGVTDEAVNDAVANPTVQPRYIPDKYGGVYRYVGKNATVNLNKDGQVVTAWANGSAGWRNP